MCCAAFSCRSEDIIAIIGITFAVLGSLGVFLLGMKMLSDALQQVAGKRLKTLLGKMTSNRFSGVLTGLLVTSVIQSSSVTTVLVVSFVSAGLFSLTQAIGVIMGANIGTTMTGWIVAVVGFRMKITSIAFPCLAIGIGMTFAKRSKVRLWGEVIVGFGLLFLGLSLMKDSMPSVGDPSQLVWIKSLTGYGVFSILLFVLIGTVVTMVLQSSSATMTTTLALAAMGWIPYQAAAALILGENIGTTVTANLAAIGATTAAKRAALVHLMFNVLGVVWAVALMNVYWLPVVDLLVPGDPYVDLAAIQDQPERAAAAAAVVTTHLAAAHTLFNVTNTVLMLPFVKQLEWLVTWMLPDRGTEPGVRERFLSTARIGSAELNVVQVGRAMQHMTKLVRNMLKDALYIISHPNEDLGEMVGNTLQVEREVDELERETLDYLTALSREPVTETTAQKIADMMQNTHRIERIADHCAVIVRIARRIHAAGTPLRDYAIEDVRLLYEHVDESLEHVGRFLLGSGSAEVGESIEDKIDTTRRKLRQKYVGMLEQEGQDRPQCLAVLNTLDHLEEIGDRAVGIIRTEAETAG